MSDNDDDTMIPGEPFNPTALDTMREAANRLRDVDPVLADHMARWAAALAREGMIERDDRLGLATDDVPRETPVPTAAPLFTAGGVVEATPERLAAAKAWAAEQAGKADADADAMNSVPDGPALVYITSAPEPAAVFIDADDFDPLAFSPREGAIARALVQLAHARFGPLA